MPWKAVSRGNEVNAVGDLHGIFQAYIGSYVSLGLLDKQGWSGGHKIVVNLGDILADRYAEGIKILLLNRKIATQASSAGGRVITLAGNHEDFALSYLMGINIAGGDKPLLMCFNDSEQGVGLGEFARFTSNKGSNFPKGDARIRYMNTKREEILKNLRETPEGKILLEELCKFQLLAHLDDTLFLHTPPTPRIIQLFLEKGVDYINGTYQAHLRKGLYEGKRPAKDFFKIRDAFLETDNRFTFDGKVRDHKNKDRLKRELEKQMQVVGMTSDQMAERLQQAGINQIVYGHNGDGGHSEVYNGGVRLTGIDYARAFKMKNSKERSILRINQKGATFVGVEQDRVR
jgi:hypothetical protein